MPTRRISRPVRVADKVIGGDAPILVQSMTNTDTEDARSTADQVAALARAGSEIVRITVNTLEAAKQVPAIRNRLEQMGVKVPDRNRDPLFGEVLSDQRELTWREEKVACWVIEYRRADVPEVRTWVREADGKVLKQEALKQGETLTVERDE